MQTGGGDLSRERIVPYECGECSEKFFSYKNYKNHMTGMYVPQLSPFMFANVFVKVLLKVMNVAPRITIQTRAVLVLNCFFSDHIMAAEEVEQRVMVSNVYQCTACAREFKDKSLLTKHFNMEHAKIARE